MGRTWSSVTLLDVRRARTPLGWLMSSDIVDTCCIVAAICALSFDHKLMPLALMGAFGVQLGGWLAAARVPK
jgi:hypothetical protein